jgi:glycosyltransferase involved in cell wall biosynthesis
LEALPNGPTVVSSTGPYGVGGLGQHLSNLVERLREVDRLHQYLCPRPKEGDLHTVGEAVESKVGRMLVRAPPVRFSPGFRVLVGNTAFDLAASRRVPRDGRHLLVFNGQALHHVKQARRLGYESVGLVSANAHLAHEAREFDKARQQYPFERPWTDANVRRNLAEYQAVDYVHVSSTYAWDSFVTEGFPEERLRMFPLTPDKRFKPRAEPPTASTFNVVYIGSLTVHKGVPLLIDSFRRLHQADLRLVLVGGFGTRGMRRHIEKACVEDPRIQIAPGDPLPQLREAGVCVHPSYGEGWGYAPSEALAMGVPLIVSENTGMTDMTDDPKLLIKVAIGNAKALAAAIESVYRG